MSNMDNHFESIVSPRGNMQSFDNRNVLPNNYLDGGIISPRGVQFDLP